MCYNEHANHTPLEYFIRSFVLLCGASFHYETIRHNVNIAHFTITAPVEVSPLAHWVTAIKSEIYIHVHLQNMEIEL